MTRNGWVGEPIDVVKVKGGYSTVDNSRALAARKAGIDVRARVHSEKAKVSSKMRSRLQDAKNPKMKAKRWGEALEFRIKRQSKKFRDMYLHLKGTYEEPRVTYPKNYWPQP